MRNDPKSLGEARRLLGQSLRPTRARKIGAFFGGTRAASTSLTPTPVDAGNSLPLKDRGIDWARMSIAGNETTDSCQNTAKPPAKYCPAKALGGIKNHVQLSNNLALFDEHHTDHKYWNMTPLLEPSAVLGRLLYPAKIVPPKGAFLRKLTQHRVLDTDVPSVRRALEYLEVKAKIKEEIHIKFHAADETVIEGSRRIVAPDLEIHLEMQDTIPGEPKVALESVRLILEDKQADLLLPHEQADIRFATKLYIKAKAQPDPRILEYINASNLSRRRLDQIETPEDLTIGIPQRFLCPNQNSSNAEDPDIPVNYSFSSIERHSILHGRPSQPGNRREFYFMFSSIDGGPIHGRRQEVRYFDSRDMPYLPDLTTKTSREQQGKTSTVNSLCECMYDVINRLRYDYRGQSRVTPHLERKIRPYRGKRLVWRPYTDVPIGSNEDTRLRAGPKLNQAFIRKVPLD